MRPKAPYRAWTVAKGVGVLMRGLPRDVWWKGGGGACRRRHCSAYAAGCWADAPQTSGKSLQSLVSRALKTVPPFTFVVNSPPSCCTRLLASFKPIEFDGLLFGSGEGMPTPLSATVSKA